MADRQDGQNDTLLEAFLFESFQLLDELEDIMITAEQNATLSAEHINEIFRIMHTIKGSAAMMAFEQISKTAHMLEDVFGDIRDKGLEGVDFGELCDIVLTALDSLRGAMGQAKDGGTPTVEAALTDRIRAFHMQLRGPDAPAAAARKTPGRTAPKATAAGAKATVSAAEQKTGGYLLRVFFEAGCGMENIRAFMLLNSVKGLCDGIYCRSSDLTEEGAAGIVREGFPLFFRAESGETVRKAAEGELFVVSVRLEQVGGLPEGFTAFTGDSDGAQDEAPAQEAAAQAAPTKASVRTDTPSEAGLRVSSTIGVSVPKLDALMDLVGEIVIAESMVLHNPDLKGVSLPNFEKASRRLHRLTDELQDVVMSTRMVPIAPVFRRMNRIVRDMEKSLGRAVNLALSGEDTEIDKSIADLLSDPLMHLVRNAVDHGLEEPAERTRLGKPEIGTVTIKACDEGGDILVSVSDDGRGLDREGILRKARERGLLTKPENTLSDKEVYAFIMQPGFSTNEKVTQYSGRGVGMDVVRNSIERIGGSLSIQSKAGRGSAFVIRIPLTLAIIEAMQTTVGDTTLSIPIQSIQESLHAKPSDLVADGMGREMVMVRGECYPVLRLHRLFGIHMEKEPDLCDGMLLIVETEHRPACLFVDRLLGQQQVVVKPLPGFLSHFGVAECGVGGCTILGDGKVSLILDVPSLVERWVQ